MRMLRAGLLASAALALVCPAWAADITAEQSALLYDLVEPVASAPTPPSGTDREVLGRAVGVLKEHRLAGQSGRPNFQESGLLEKYGKALFLEQRMHEFVPEIGKIHDLVLSGERARLEQALSDLWVKAGRSKPDAKALEPVIAALNTAKEETPQETVRHVMEKPGSRTEVMHAPASGRVQVDVVTKNADGTDKERTAIQGVTEAVPTADGKNLQRRMKLDKICTSTPESDKETLEKLAGDWVAEGNGRTWKIGVKGDQVTLEENRGALPMLRYTGTYHLGKIAATHPITAVTDMEDNLPVAVRQALTGMNISFRIALDFCGDDVRSLKGTWSSQNVTYSGMTQEVKRVHDPYDLSLVLRKGTAAMKTAPGAGQDETL